MGRRRLLLRRLLRRLLLLRRRLLRIVGRCPAPRSWSGEGRGHGRHGRGVGQCGRHVLRCTLLEPLQFLRVHWSRAAAFGWARSRPLAARLLCGGLGAHASGGTGAEPGRPPCGLARRTRALVLFRASLFARRTAHARRRLEPLSASPSLHRVGSSGIRAGSNGGQTGRAKTSRSPVEVERAWRWFIRPILILAKSSSNVFPDSGQGVKWWVGMYDRQAGRQGALVLLCSTNQPTKSRFGKCSAGASFISCVGAVGACLLARRCGHLWAPGAQDLTTHIGATRDAVHRAVRGPPERARGRRLLLVELYMHSLSSVPLAPEAGL